MKSQPEEIMKTKWCPFANVYEPYTRSAGNRNLGDKRDLAYCIGSRCALWDEDVNIKGVGRCGMAK